MAKLNDRSEKGLLTHSNCVVALIDLQPQMLFGVDETFYALPLARRALLTTKFSEALN
jgi:hypothetical protein